MPSYQQIMEWTGTAIDGVGVAVIVIGLIQATLLRLLRPLPDRDERFRRYRQDLGKSILLGLEFLVAGDIIRTVAVAPNLQNLTNLGLIVLIRTFLSLALEVELDGRFPWNRAEAEAADSSRKQ